MTHTASHIILSSLNTPTTASGKIPVYYYVMAACLLCYVIGYFVGKF